MYQFGHNLHAVLKPSSRIQWEYCEPQSEAELRLTCHSVDPAVTLVNWQALIGGYLAHAPFPWMKNPVFCYHDCEFDDARWKAVLFADPTMQAHGKWHSIGRPIQEFKTMVQTPELRRPIIGVHGFLGAWSDQVVHRVLQEFEFATVRLQLPFSRFCDANGAQALAMAERCKTMALGTGVQVEATHDFLPEWALLAWLSQNDLNAYIRPPEMNWRGVSSAPDRALSVRRPLAVNKCSAFRHLHHTNPSICVEDCSLTEILQNGLNPLIPLYNAWEPDVVRYQVEEVLCTL